MPELAVAQAVFEGDKLRAKSDDFTDEWVESSAQLCRGFGPPAAGTPCPEAVFARPFGKSHVAVVTVAGPPVFTPPRFRVLLLERRLYDHLHDPFAIAERFPPAWDARGTLPGLEWPPEPLPRRAIAALDDVLKHGDGPLLLAAAQALVDSGKVLLRRPGPEPGLVRDLWALLPDSTRRATWPASFAYANDLGFDLLVMPGDTPSAPPGYLNEDQTRDYPDSHYERELQTAIEAGDQRLLDRLLARRSSAETLRLAASIVALAVGIMTVVKVLGVLKVI
jgi:hypothetical protein